MWIVIEKRAGFVRIVSHSVTETYAIILVNFELL